MNDLATANVIRDDDDNDDDDTAAAADDDKDDVDSIIFQISTEFGGFYLTSANLYLLGLRD